MRRLGSEPPMRTLESTSRVGTGASLGSYAIEARNAEGVFADQARSDGRGPVRSAGVRPKGHGQDVRARRLGRDAYPHLPEVRSGRSLELRAVFGGKRGTNRACHAFPSLRWTVFGFCGSGADGSLGSRSARTINSTGSSLR